jgi:adenosylcobyric acid synthase
MYLRKCGLDRVITQKYEAGIPIIGICGGYQMLGKHIKDPYQSESQHKGITGLGLIDSETVFNREKKTIQVKARVTCDNGLLKNMKGIEVKGYEIHMGQTNSQNYIPAFQITESLEANVDNFDGVVCSNGMIFGTYIHGVFHNEDFTEGLLNNLRKMRGLPEVKLTKSSKQENYNKLAQLVKENIDMSRVYKIIEGESICE